MHTETLMITLINNINNNNIIINPRNIHPQKYIFIDRQT